MQKNITPRGIIFLSVTNSTPNNLLGLLFFVDEAPALKKGAFLRFLQSPGGEGAAFRAYQRSANPSFLFSKLKLWKDEVGDRAPRPVEGRQAACDSVDGVGWKSRAWVLVGSGRRPSVTITLSMFA
ncbi:hypothetical protein B296_00026845 [Ensete ventricosum]|uniref:Uncharacterized protein n=1 Tax=Ensete ventricosum TaxID=4639 RepID=A0A426ZYB4_ENSVE|nr:hypothetical protein B296_00026845 [Ensete ventricosum]